MRLDPCVDLIGLRERPRDGDQVMILVRLGECLAEKKGRPFRPEPGGEHRPHATSLTQASAATKIPAPTIPAVTKNPVCGMPRIVGSATIGFAGAGVGFTPGAATGFGGGSP